MMADQRGRVGVDKYFFTIKKRVSKDWKDLADCLGLWGEVGNIESRNRDDESCCRDLLGVWKTRKGDAATMEVLMEALSEAGLQEVVDHLREKFPELRVSRPPAKKTKRDREDPDQTHVQPSKKLRTHPDGEDGGSSILGQHVVRSDTIGDESTNSEYETATSEDESATSEDESATSEDERNNKFYRFVERSRQVFHEGVLRHPETFSTAVDAFRRHANIVLGEDESNVDDSDEQKLSKRAKLTIRKKINDEIARVDDQLFTDDTALRNTPIYDGLTRSFQHFRATLRKATRGCVLCYLDFEDESCYKTFLRAYRDTSLSDTLTRELITDDMRAAEGEDLYVHVTLLGEDEGCQDDSFSDEGTLSYGQMTEVEVAKEKTDAVAWPGGIRKDRVSKEYFNKVIAKVSHKWDDLARTLGFSRNDIKSIRTAVPSPELRCGEMLRRWSNKEGSGATLQVLRKALIDIGERLTAESLQEIDGQLSAVADHLGSMWERLALSLGFNTDYIRGLSARLTAMERPRQLMMDWKKRNAGDVTLDQLFQALKDAGIHEIADELLSGRLFLQPNVEAVKEKAAKPEASEPGRKGSDRWQPDVGAGPSGIRTDTAATELDRQLNDVADHLSSTWAEFEQWERLALSLGFNTDYIRDLRARLTFWERPRQLMMDWKNRNAGDVTLDQLVQALKDAGMYEVADEVSSGRLLKVDVEAAKEKASKPEAASVLGRKRSDHWKFHEGAGPSGIRADAAATGGRLDLSPSSSPIKKLLEVGKRMFGALSPPTVDCRFVAFTKPRTNVLEFHVVCRDKSVKTDEYLPGFTKCGSSAAMFNLFHGDVLDIAVSVRAGEDKSKQMKLQSTLCNGQYGQNVQMLLGRPKSGNRAKGLVTVKKVSLNRIVSQFTFKEKSDTFQMPGKKRRSESQQSDDGAGPSRDGGYTQPTAAADMQACFEKVIAGVSHKWEDLARKLGFSEKQIDRIHSSKIDQDRRCREMLRRWRKMKGMEATLKVLKQALIDIDESLTAESL
ncbi:uncharacterized protein LOC144915005 isoform X2 [Branchiostoma floridae x Branchiostoma belcheri]